MKICVVTPLYAISGVPLAQTRFAQALADAGHEVDLVIGRVSPGFASPQLDRVRLTVFDKPDTKSMLPSLVRYLRRAAPDVVFSAEDHLNVFVLLAALIAGSKAKISGSSRVTPFDTYSDRLFSKRWVLKQIVRALMWRADALTCVSADMVEQYRQVFRRAPHQAVYNIVDDARARQRLAEPVPASWRADSMVPVIVAAGQLEEWKRFSDLIEAVSLVAARRPVRLVIFGEGSLRADLERLIATRGLTNVVTLPGNVANPLRFFARSDVFALTSRVEGLPNVLVEAMMCGCTPVATDCPTGPREVLAGGKYGYLVEVGNPASIAAGLERALDHPIDKALLDEAVRPFEVKAVLKRHFEILAMPVSRVV